MPSPAVRTIVATMLGLMLLGSTALLNGAPPTKPRVVRALPGDAAALEAAFAAAANHRCRPVRADQPYEVRQLTPSTLTAAGFDNAAAADSLPIPAGRSTVLTVGLSLTQEDRDALPLAGGPFIRSYLNGYYVALQVFVRRNLDTGELCLHDQAAAAHMQFTDFRLTTSFEPLVLKSLQDTRCLGLWIEPDKLVDEDPLRTLVFIVRHPMYDASYSPDSIRSKFELLFVRAKPAVSAVGDEQLDLHAFMTSDRGSRLLYLSAPKLPVEPAECTVDGDVTFLQYSADGQTPTLSALRDLRFQSRASIATAELDRFAAGKGAASWRDRLNDVLDAVIAGELK